MYDIHKIICKKNRSIESITLIGQHLMLEAVRVWIKVFGQNEEQKH